jgi:hypothetical protein
MKNQKAEDAMKMNPTQIELQTAARAKLALYLGLMLGKERGRETITRDTVLLVAPMVNGYAMALTYEDLMNAAGIDLNRYLPPAEGKETPKT